MSTLDESRAGLNQSRDQRDRTGEEARVQDITERSRLEEQRQALDYERCFYRPKAFERHLKYNWLMLLIFVGYALGQWIRFNIFLYIILVCWGSVAFFIIRLIVTYFFVCTKKSRVVTSEEKCKILRSMLTRSVWAGCLAFGYLYITNESQASGKVMALMMMYPISVLGIDICVASPNTVGRIMSGITKLWMALTSILGFIFLNNSYLVNRDLGIINTSAGTTIYFHIVHGSLLLITLFFGIKIIDTRVYLCTHQVENRVFILRCTTYIFLAFLVNYFMMISGFILYSQGMFTSQHFTKAILAIGNILLFSSLIFLQIKWRNDIILLMEVKLKDISRVYPTCTRKRRNQVASAIRVRTAAQIAGQNNGQLNGDQNGGRPENPEPRAVLSEQQQPEIALQSSVGDPPQPKFEKEESLHSLRFIERKNSVVFGKITAKKLLTVLQDDGQIEKERIFAEEIDEKGPKPDSSKASEYKRVKSMPCKDMTTDELPPERQQEALSPSSPKRKRSDLGVYDAQSNDKINFLFSKENKIIVKKDNSTTISKTSIYDKIKDLMISMPSEHKSEENMTPSTPKKAGSGEDKDKEGDWELGMCLICEQEKANSIIYPCYHSKVCYSCCLNMLGWQFSKCHYCRNNLEKIIVFDPYRSYKNIFKVQEVYSINYEEE